MPEQPATIDSSFSQEIQEHLDLFVEYLKSCGYIYKLNVTGVELYSSRTKIVYPYHAESALYNQYLRQHKSLPSIAWQTAFHDYLLHKIPFVSGFVFKPNADLRIPYLDGSTALNIYKQYAPSTEMIADYDFTHWLAFIEHLLPDEIERHTVCQWLGHMFQKPEERPSWHLMLISDTGTGKGFLYHNVLYPLLSKQAVLLNNFKKLTGQFSTVLDGNMLVFLDDAKSKSDVLATELKSILSDPSQMIEAKYEQAKMVENYARFIFASNEYRPLRLDDNERRWYVPKRIEHRINRDHTQSIIDSLEDWLNAGGLDQLYYWFMSYSLESFRHTRCEQTETLKAMITSSKTALETDLTDWLEGKLAFKLSDAEYALNAPKDLIRHHLTEAGYQEKYLYPKGDRSRYYKHRSISSEDARRYIEQKRTDCFA